MEEISMLEEIVEEVQQPEPPRICRRKFIRRDRVQAHNDLIKKYFAPDCIFPTHMFRLWFRMRRDLFHSIQTQLEEHEPYFNLSYDATGRPGFSSIQKMTTALRVLAYGSAIDREDDTLSIAQTTATETVRMFCQSIINIYSEQYLRAQNKVDLARLLAENEARGFPGMIGSLDCMHWEWRNCPTAWHGQFVGHTGRPTLILEAVASQDLWIWHAFFGMARTYNEISVLDNSPLFDRFIQCQTPYTLYVVNGRTYHVPYYLTDGIYPHYATLVQSIKRPRTEKEKHFSKRQEVARKDVERVFGVLQAKWAITQGPVRFWDKETLKNIMQCCIILHNMVIEDERYIGIEPWQPIIGENIPDDLLQKDAEWLGTYIHNRMQQVWDICVNANCSTPFLSGL